MSIAKELVSAFPVLNGDPLVSEGQIINHPDPLMLDLDSDMFDVVPFYLLWCANHPDTLETISDGTLHAVAEFGRCKDPSNNYLSFMYRCNDQQMQAMTNFLLWFASNIPFYDKQRFETTLANWQAAANK